jgi:hypothetical protein
VAAKIVPTVGIDDIGPAVETDDDGITMETDDNCSNKTTNQMHTQL